MPKFDAEVLSRAAFEMSLDIVPKNFLSFFTEPIIPNHDNIFDIGLDFPDDSEDEKEEPKFEAPPAANPTTSHWPPRSPTS